MVVHYYILSSSIEETKEALLLVGLLNILIFEMSFAIMKIFIHDNKNQNYKYIFNSLTGPYSTTSKL